MNAHWVEYAVLGRQVPNPDGSPNTRRSLRDRLRGDPEVRPIRRVIFGAWRQRYFPRESVRP